MGNRDRDANGVAAPSTAATAAGGPARTGAPGAAAPGGAPRRGLLDPRVHPPSIHPPYASTVTRGPKEPLVALPHGLTDVTGPVFGEGSVTDLDADLTRNAVRDGEPIGERIIVTGRVLGEDGRPVRHALLEVWQSNAAGRYIHRRDQHDAPLDPNFTGCGRCLTDAEGRYTFTTIKPGAYPWRNHANAWRPPHIHVSVFGRGFHERLVTQMYFPGDPLLAYDPIYQGIPDENARRRLVSHYAHDVTRPEWALGYRFDVVLAGPLRTPFEEPHA